ncbi:activator of stress genes 1 [Echria macrotheca]|uniref:Activator of stress genes 1 n=1 Tax=Echria macrotheca TaxID=438768 RepID=A0AAJ0BIB3_9PEZI|nr:activator of stress genes 1 [Echria macrotheca]
MPASSSAITLADLERRVRQLETQARQDTSADVSSTSDTSVPIPQGQTPATRNSDSEDALDEILPTSGFMRQAANAASPRAQESEPPAPVIINAPPSALPHGLGFSMERQDPTPEMFDHQQVVLPPKSFADELVRWYWHHIHSLYPLLHRPSFEAEYKKLYSPQDSRKKQSFDDLVFLAVFNIVLALGCQRNESISPAQQGFHAEEFYRRSLRLISLEDLDTSSLSLIQLFVLRGIYLYFTTRADRCWIVLGAGIRMAIGMGLNNAGPKKVSSQLEREMRRRIWYCGCVTMDQVVSTLFGRPTMIYSQINNAPLPLYIDDQYLSSTHEGRQPEKTPARVAHSIYSLGLIQTLDDMRAEVLAGRRKASNGPSGNADVLPDSGNLLRIYSRLEDQLNNAPAHLQPDADYASMPVTEDDIACFKVQSRVLRTRMMLLKLMLLRPSVLAEVHRSDTNKPRVQSSAAMLEERLHREVCELCLSTVHLTLEEIHQALYTPNEFPAWYCLQVTFSAATVLVASTLSPVLGVSLDTEPGRSSWDRAIEIMERHKSTVASAEKGIEVAQQFRRYMESKVSARQSAQGSSNNAILNSVPDTFPTVLPVEFGSVSFDACEEHQAGRFQLNYGLESPSTAIEGLDLYLSSNSLDQAWLATQDFGQNDWILHWA